MTQFKNVVLIFSILTNMQLFGQNASITNRYWVLEGISQDLTLESLLIPEQQQNFSLSYPQVLDDSNTYSTIEFGLGMRENQFIDINFFRPAEKGLFVFDFKRISNQGWNDNNLFIQGNDLTVDYQRSLTSRITARVSLSVDNHNYQLNGGLVDSAYIFPSLNADESLISTDVNSLDGNHSGNHVKSGLDLSFNIIDDSTKRFDLNTTVGYLRDVNRFSDNYSDLPYFKKYPVGIESNELNDSIFRNEVSGAVFLSFSSKDLIDTLNTNLLRYYSVQTGLRSGLGEINSNFDTWLFYRYSVFVDSEFWFKRWKILMSGNSVVMGLDQGSFHLNTKGSYNILSDSLRQVELNGSLSMTNDLPEMVFYRHTSQLGNIRETPNFVRSQVGDINLNHTAENSRIQCGVSFRSLGNYAVMDKNMSVERISFLAASFSVQGNLSYKRFDFSNYSAYQLTSSDHRFSLPKVVSRGSVSYNLSLFKKAISIKPGIEAVFYSDYYAMGFHPNLMNYYVQSDKMFGSYLTSNAYLNARVQAVDVSLRLENWNYDLFGQEPLVAPNYPGVPRFFQVRVKWVFKN